MPDFLNVDSEFLRKTISQVEANMGDEHFGVSELADQVGMSRSNLLRKIQKLTGLSVSVFMRQVRLHNAQQMLQDDTLNVSEVAYKVGFNSVSYFIKCYRELYGYPPGEEQGTQIGPGSITNTASSIEEPQVTQVAVQDTPHVPKTYLGVRLNVLFSALLIIVLVVLTAIYLPKQRPAEKVTTKSIAVLPFQNDSADSSNVYIINGLMEAILNNLQKIEDLRVVSRTSVEKYRGHAMNIAEISKELNVDYFIEGSGQKIGDQILLTIQLIEAPEDDHLWSEQYNKQATDIFQLQSEVAKDIAQEIQVLVTPEEARRIEKIPTQNLGAYDSYLRGLELTALTNQSSTARLHEAIVHFNEAIDKDPNFALAHAYIAICYYYIDLFQSNQQYKDEINHYADKALLLDAELPQSLIAKGLYYMQTSQYGLATEFFEKVLEYNPNSARANNFLSEIYNAYLPNTQLYLKYALRGIQLEMTGYDSGVVSFSYMHLANALIQNGFVDEAESQIKRSLDYDSGNIFSQYIHAYILLAQDMDVGRTRRMLEATFAKDTTRLDVLQELAKMCFADKDYEAAMAYYDAFTQARIRYNIDIFPDQDLVIGQVYELNGKDSIANHYYALYKQYAERDQSIYKDLNLTNYYTVIGEYDKAISHLEKFAEQEHFQYWIVLLLDSDQTFEQMKSIPRFMKVMEKIKSRFWAEHEQTRVMLEESGLL